MAEVLSRRCLYCERYWPPEEGYRDCPCCREPTESNLFVTPRDYDREPLDHGRAAALASTFEFGWFLWDNDLL